MNSSRVLLVAVFAWCLPMLFLAGCAKKPSPQSIPTISRTPRRQQNTEALLAAISNSLNHLPNEVVEELTPPVKILDDTTSADGQEVLATCSVNPQVPDGPNNYLVVPKGNANFRSLRVVPGDIVRYFVTVANEEEAERGFGEITYLELTVRRLDANNPQNALIVEGGLTGPMLTPARIEIWRYSDRRVKEILVRLNRYVVSRRPAVGWEPSPDETSLHLLIDRVNSWLRNTTPDPQWQLDPQLEALPAALRESSEVALLVAEEALARGQFPPSEGRLLQEAIWLRDTAAWAKGDALGEVEIASKLFDWVVRNMQLDDDAATDIIHHPWQALMYGHASAVDRAWVFAELCRQQQLDVVMLAIATDADESTRWWLPALVKGEQLHLFDTRLGLPIPGSKPGTVATLAEVVDDPSLLRKLDFGEEHIYPVAADDLAHVEVHLVATPLQLSRRAATLQSALAGDEFVMLAADLRRLRKSLGQLAHIDAVRLWPFPFQSIVDESNAKKSARLEAAQRFNVFALLPQLWKARVLHFQGTKPIPIEDRDDPLAQPRRGHREATDYYQNRRIRPSNKTLNRLEPAKQIVYRRAKYDASYWLGLLRFELGNYRVAADWFRDRTLAAVPNGVWTAGASYNLARAYESLGRKEEAAKLLESIESPQRYGNLLRARRLKKQLDVSK